MVNYNSLRLGIVSAFVVATVVAHPFNHVNAHAKRQTVSTPSIVWVTIYQTQAAGPGGEPKTFTVLSPMWANAAPTGDNALTSNSTLPEPTSIGIDPTTAASTAPLTDIDSLIPTAASTPTASLMSDASSTPIASSPPSSNTAASSAIAFTVAQGEFAEKAVSPTKSLVVPSYISAVTSIVSTPSAVSPSTAPSTGGSGGHLWEPYFNYSGVPSQYPAESEFITFEELFNASMGDASKGMLSYHISEDNIKFLKENVQSISKAGGVDPRISFAMIMQESHGDPTKAGSGGIMQCDGCPTGSWSTVPDAIKGGVAHLKMCLGMYPQNQPWVALRCYNSGQSFDVNDLNIAPGTTPSYVTDIANRLVRGWTV